MTAFNVWKDYAHFFDFGMANFLLGLNELSFAKFMIQNKPMAQLDFSSEDYRSIGKFGKFVK